MDNSTRRQFGRTVLAGAAASITGKLLAQGQETACAPPTGEVIEFVIPTNLKNIQRKPISALNQNEINRLRLGYQKLRDLSASDPTDPRGWLQQANVHCWQCGGSGTDIHSSWKFLPWHRAFLYFHERILCKLLNDNTFRLPYWSWDDKSTRSLPAIYRSASINGKSNSLYDEHRSTDAAKGSSMPASIFPQDSNPMNAGNFASFGGSDGHAGSLEDGPHGAVHNWTGSNDDQSSDMGNLWLAGRDPVFFAHHCNIDRLWAEWNRRNPVAHANPTDGSFLGLSFNFFDENKQLVNIKVQDVLDTAPLGFSYPPGAKLAKTKIPKWTQLTYDTGTHLLQLPQTIRARVIAPSVIAVQRSLVVEQVVLPMKSGTYNVFVGEPPAAGADQSTASNYLGYIGLIVSPHMHDHKCSLVLNATTEFLQRAGNGGAMLTFAAAGTTKGERLEFSTAYLTEE